MLVARDVWLTPAGAPDAVVRGLSFEVSPGEWLAVTGSNGSGKTTLALAAAGLLAPDRGKLEWRGRQATDRAPRAGAGPVLAVLQDPSTQLLQPTVAEELRYTATNLGHDPAAIERELAELASRLGFEPDSGLDPHALSAGQQQQVLLAAALVCRPALLVADEPCAHLDAAARSRVLEIVAERVAGGMAVIWVTQDSEESARATRTLDLSPAPVSPSPPIRPPAEGPVGLELTVTPDFEISGPRIRTTAEFRLEVRRPGLLALEGPNGSGKSVLLAAVCGLAPCRQVRLSWRSGAPEAPPLMVSQYPELMVFRDRVDDELAFAAVSRGRPRAEALEAATKLLQKLELNPGILSRSVWDLSTGEKRLVEIVAALIAPASLLALDEPTGGLDPCRRAILATLVADQASRTAVVVASQDAEWVARLGCRRWVFGSTPYPPSIGQKRD